jgi:hypothetical protein
MMLRKFLTGGFLRLSLQWLLTQVTRPWLLMGLMDAFLILFFTQALLPQEISLSSALREMSAIHRTLLCRGRTLKMLQPTTLWW